jgi:hypothetical protein
MLVKRKGVGGKVYIKKLSDYTMSHPSQRYLNFSTISHMNSTDFAKDKYEHGQGNKWHCYDISRLSEFKACSFNFLY